MSTLRKAAQQALEQPNAVYERGFVDGMSEQAKRSVDRAVNRMANAQMRENALARWAHAQEEPPDTDWQRGYEAARRWVRQVGLPSLAQQDVPETNFGNMEPVAWTDRELELIDGMIEVQLHHAAQCDAIANRPMAERQKGWDMERVALLRKIKSSPPRREMVAATRAAIAKAEGGQT